MMSMRALVLFVLCAFLFEVAFTSSFSWRCVRPTFHASHEEDPPTTLRPIGMIDGKVYALPSDPPRVMFDKLYVLDTRSEDKELTPTWAEYRASWDESSDFVDENGVRRLEKARDFFSSATVNGKIYLFGGKSDVLECDPQKKEWKLREVHSAARPPIRMSHAVTNSKNSIAMFGGFSGRRLSDMHVFDVHRGIWENVVYANEAPKERSGSSIVRVDSLDKILVLGGKLDTNGTSDMQVHMLDLFSRQWEKIPEDTSDNVPQGRMNAAMFFSDPYVFLFGGIPTLSDDPKDDLTSSLWLYHLNKRTWTSIELGGDQPLLDGIHNFAERSFLGHSSQTSSDEGEIVLVDAEGKICSIDYSKEEINKLFKQAKKLSLYHDFLKYSTLLVSGIVGYYMFSKMGATPKPETATTKTAPLANASNVRDDEAESLDSKMKKRSRRTRKKRKD